MMQLERERLRVYVEAEAVWRERNDDDIGLPDAAEVAQIYRELANVDAVLELLESE